ncbi:MAG: F0F1 ATP synthase subunit C [Pseudomonadota bacterium]
MDADAARLIGAGLACTGLIGAGIGVGSIFGNFLSGAMRNPGAADSQFARVLVGAAFAEALGLFALVVAMLILFG